MSLKPITAAETFDVNNWRAPIWPLETIMELPKDYHTVPEALVLYALWSEPISKAILNRRVMRLAETANFHRIALPPNHLFPFLSSVFAWVTNRLYLDDLLINAANEYPEALRHELIRSDHGDIQDRYEMIFPILNTLFWKTPNVKKAFRPCNSN